MLVIGLYLPVRKRNYYERFGTAPVRSAAFLDFDTGWLSYLLQLTKYISIQPAVLLMCRVGAGLPSRLRPRTGFTDSPSLRGQVYTTLLPGYCPEMCRRLLLQCSAVQCSTVQCSAVQCSARRRLISYEGSRECGATHTG